MAYLDTSRREQQDDIEDSPGQDRHLDKDGKGSRNSLQLCSRGVAVSRACSCTSVVA